MANIISRGFGAFQRIITRGFGATTPAIDTPDCYVSVSGAINSETAIISTISADSFGELSSIGLGSFGLVSGIGPSESAINSTIEGSLNVNGHICG